MAIGSCDCCDRQNVPISNVAATFAHPEASACFLCRGYDDPDPYCEMEAPARCKTNIAGFRGECIHCGAWSGEACRDHSVTRPDGNIPPENVLTGAALGRWCYENPNLAARTIELLRASRPGSGEGQ
jgi:hypothetical protein